MNISASIVDQRVSGIAEQFDNELGVIVGPEASRQKSLAFVLLCVSTVLDCPLEEALDLLTEGGNDLGVDAMHLSMAQSGAVYPLLCLLVPALAITTQHQTYIGDIAVTD